MKTTSIRTHFETTGVKERTVSALALGIARFGGMEKEKENHAQLDCFLSGGGSLVDTALVYGQWVDETQQSYSELILGDYLEAADHKSKIVVSTKGAHPKLGTMQMRVTPECIDSDIAQSLINLRTNNIDIYFLHRDDEGVPVAAIMDALNRHAERGEIGLLGASNWSARRIYEANDYCVKHHMSGFDLSQICFNIIRTTPKQMGDLTLVSMTDEEEALYRDMDMTIMAFTSLAGGFVSKFFNTADADIHSPYACADTFARMRRIREVCRDANLTPTAVTLGYLLGQDLPVIPIASMSSIAQLEDCMKCMDTALTKEQIAWIDGK